MIEIENAFLGSLIKDFRNLDNIVDVKRDWFLGQNNKIVFDAIKSLYKRGKTVDQVTVKSFISQTFKKDFNNHIDEILSGDYNPANFKAYQEDLGDRYLKTSMLNCLNESTLLIEKAPHGSISKAIDDVEKKIFELTQLGSGSSAIHKLGDVGIGVMTNLKKVREEGLKPFMASTGYTDIDSKFGGFNGGDFVIIAGRPSMGKTAFALQLARKNMSKNNIAVGMLSLEMTKEKIFLRFLSSESKINSLRILSGRFNQNEFDQMAVAWKEINKMPFYIDDKSSMTEMHIRSSARRMVAMYGIKLLIIDYLQLADSSETGDGRQQEVTRISKSMKGIAKELNIPIIALSQLSRRVEERKPPRPILSDLRESGSIEQDADIVLFVYRPDHYGIETFEDGIPTTNIAEIIVGKARDGEIGSARTIFVKDRGSFESLSNE